MSVVTAESLCSVLLIGEKCEGWSGAAFDLVRVVLQVGLGPVSEEIDLDLLWVLLSLPRLTIIMKSSANVARARAVKSTEPTHRCANFPSNSVTPLNGVGVYLCL